MVTWLTFTWDIYNVNQATWFWSRSLTNCIISDSLIRHVSQKTDCVSEWEREVFPTWREGISIAVGFVPIILISRNGRQLLGRGTAHHSLTPPSLSNMVQSSTPAERERRISEKRNKLVLPTLPNITCNYKWIKKHDLSLLSLWCKRNETSWLICGLSVRCKSLHTLRTNKTFIYSCEIFFFLL